MKKFADIHVNIQTRQYQEVEHVALSGECHLVVSSFDLVKPETLNFHPLEAAYTGRLYCAKNHILASAMERGVAFDMEEYPAVAMSGLSSANYARDGKRLMIKTWSDCWESCRSAIMTGEYIGLLPDYLVREGMQEFLVPISDASFVFEHQLYVMNGKNVRLNPVLKHCIKELSWFLGSGANNPKVQPKLAAVG